MQKVNQILNAKSKQNIKEIVRLTASISGILLEHHWPGFNLYFSSLSSGVSPPLCTFEVLFPPRPAADVYWLSLTSPARVRCNSPALAEQTLVWSE